MRKRRIVAFVMCAVMQMCPVITMADDVAQTQETMSAEGTSAKSVKTGLVPTRSEGRRAIEQGGVSIDGEKITDVKYVVAKDALAGDGIVLKKGKKKFNKIVAK